MDIEYKKKLTSSKHIIFLTIPIFIELFLQMVVGYCDQAMMSRWDAAVNGISNANVVITMVIGAFQVLSAASIILITQYRGSKDEEKLNHVYSTAFYFNLVTGTLFSLLIVFTSKFYLNWIRTPKPAYNDALIYSIIAGGTVVFQLMSTTLSSFLKADNHMRDSMIITIIVNLINVIGNYVLIEAFIPTGLPVIGVALSSAISRLIGFILMFIMFKKRINIKLSFKSFLKDKSMLKKILQVGGPSGGESVSYQSSQIIIQLVVNQIVIASASNVGIGNIRNYAGIFAMVTYMFTSAISQAMQVIIGELLGARELKDVKRKVWQTIIISIISSEIIALIFYIFSDQLFGLFNITDPYLLSIAKNIMLIEILLEFGRAINIVMVRALQTSGDVMFPTISAIIFCWVVAVGGSFLFGYPKENGLSLGLIGVWIAMCLDESIRAIIFLIRFIKGKWMKFNLTE